MLAVGRRNVARAALDARITLHKLDAKHTGFADGSFGGIVSNSIVHHIPHPADIFAELWRVLGRSGVLFVRDLFRPASDAIAVTLVDTYAPRASHDDPAVTAMHRNVPARPLRRVAPRGAHRRGGSRARRPTRHRAERGRGNERSPLDPRVHEAVTCRAFPWSTFESLTYADAASNRALRRWGEAHTVAGDIARALHEVTGARVEISVRRIRHATEPRPLDGSVAVVLAGPDERSLGRGVLLEAEGGLAAALVARALERPAPKIIDPARPGSGRIAGALAAIVISAARRSHAGTPLRVLTAGPGAALASDFARFVPDAIVAELTVLVDDTAHLARVVLDRAPAFASAGRPWDRERLTALGDILLALPVVVAASAGSAFEVASLAVGDVWIPGAWPLARTATGAWVGLVTVAAPSLEVGACATLGEDGRLVLRGGVEDLAWTPPRAKERR